jgi:hypothetical protein
MWRYEGAGAEGAGGTSSQFPTQAEAEAWLGDAWRDLLDRDVRAVTLLEGEREVYGPMGLEPA